MHRINCTKLINYLHPVTTTSQQIVFLNFRKQTVLSFSTLNSVLASRYTNAGGVFRKSRNCISFPPVKQGQSMVKKYTYKGLFVVNTPSSLLHTSSLNFKDYYQTLNISKNASYDDVKKAYYNIGTQYISVIYKDDPVAQNKFQEASEAYEVLGCEEKRLQYDAIDQSRMQIPKDDNTPNAFQDSWSYQSHVDPKELFARVFGGSDKSYNRKENELEKSSTDLKATHETQATETINKVSQLNAVDICPKCGSSRVDMGTKECPYCNTAGMKNTSTVTKQDGIEGKKNVIKIRGLPWSATKDDIITFFGGIKICNGHDGIHMDISKVGLQRGEAFIEFEDETEVQRAKEKHRQLMGKRYIEVFEVQNSVLDRQSKPPHHSNYCVRLRGLPFGCDNEEIVQFFSGLDIVPNGITRSTDYIGRDSGEAYVQFIDEAAVVKAIEKDNERIGHRYIEVFESTLDEIKTSLSNNMRGSRPVRGFRQPSYDSRDVFEKSSRYNMDQSRDSDRSFNQSYNHNDDQAYVKSSFSDNWGRGRRMEERRLEIKGNFEERNFKGNLSGHCVHMRGLPYKAAESEIVEFFRPLTPVNIKIRMDKWNRSVGDAFVEFATHSEAVKAMNKDREHMQHRYIELFLHSRPSNLEN